MTDEADGLEIEVPRAFLPLLGPARYKGAWSGRSAGKSHFFAEQCVARCLRKNTRIVCIREKQRSLNQSVKALIEDKIKKFGQEHRFRVLSTYIEENKYGGRIIFEGMQDHTAESIKSLEGYDVAWVEEAQVLSKRSLEMLRPTIRAPGSELWFSWNPRFETDPIDQFLRGPDRFPDSIVVECSYADNPWFPAEMQKEMEWDRERDPDKYAHVWLGGYLKHAASRVFTNWTIDEIEVPDGARPHFGADWGFSVDPTALVRCYFLEPRTLYIDKEIHAIGVDIDKTPELFDGMPDAARWPITADSSRPETISYMQRHGYPGIKRARKGPGSVEEGVEFLKSYDIVVHPDCQHSIDELTLYSYKVDKQTEQVLPVLEDKKNHVIDALRYAAEDVRMASINSALPKQEDFLEEPHKIPTHWPKVFAVDVREGSVSCVWGAIDEELGVIHITGEYFEPRIDLTMACVAIRDRESWIPGLFDHMAHRRTIAEGQKIVDRMVSNHLDIITARADYESSVSEMESRLTTKRLRVWSNLPTWLSQYRAFRRDEKGQLPDENVGLIRATGMLAMHGMAVALPLGDAAEYEMSTADASRDAHTGY